MVIYAGRTANGISRQARAQAEHPVLRIDGLVRQPLRLAPEDLSGLPRAPYRETLTAEEREGMPDTDWAGIRLSDLLDLVELDSEARFVRVCGGPYAVPVSLHDAEHVLICDRLDGKPMTVEQGGPWRLVSPGSRYNMSVKWIDRIEVTAELPDDSASRIAVARARAREKKARDLGIDISSLSTEM